MSPLPIGKMYILLAGCTYALTSHLWFIHDIQFHIRKYHSYILTYTFLFFFQSELKISFNFSVLIITSLFYFDITLCSTSLLTELISMSCLEATKPFLNLVNICSDYFQNNTFHLGWSLYP